MPDCKKCGKAVREGWFKCGKCGATIVFEEADGEAQADVSADPVSTTAEGKGKGQSKGGGGGAKGSKGAGKGAPPPAPKARPAKADAGAAPKASSRTGGWKLDPKVDGHWLLLVQGIPALVSEYPQGSDGAFSFLVLHSSSTTAKWPEEAIGAVFFTTVFVTAWQQFLQSHHFDEKEQVAELKVGDGRSEVQKETIKKKLTVEEALKAFGEKSPHGSEFVARAEAFLAANASPDGAEEAKARAWVDKHVDWPHYKPKNTGKGISEEDRKKKEEEQRRKDMAAAQKRRELQEHWQALSAAPVEDVAWTTCQKTMHAGGGTGGCLLVELEGARAICVKPQGSNAVSEFLAERVLKALDVPVATCRPVRWSSDEYRTLVAEVIKVPIMGGTSPEVVKMALTGNSRFGQTEEIGVEYVGVLEYVSGHGLMGIDAHSALAGEHANSIYRGLGRVCAADVLINNLDRVPLPIWANDGNLSNVMVKLGGQVVAIDQQLNAIVLGPARDKYLSKVRQCVEDCALGAKSKAAAAIKQALLDNTGTEASDEALAIAVEELNSSLGRAAQLVSSGAFEERLSLAESDARDAFRHTVCDLGQDRIEAMVDFVRCTASAVKAAVGQ